MKPGSAFTVALALGLAIASVALLRERGRSYDLALESDRLEAVADSTRDISDSLRVLGVDLGDSIRVVERRVVQAEIEVSTLDTALRRSTRVRLGLEAQVRTLESDSATGIVTDIEGSRSATFTGQRIPYQWSAEVVLPPPPGEGLMSLSVVLDPARFELAIQCSDDATSGVRQATANLTGPDWLEFRLDRVRQDPNICSPEHRLSGFSVSTGLKIGLPVIGLLALLLALK